LEVSVPRRTADTLARWTRPLFFLGHNPLTLVGAVVTTSAAVTMVGFWIVEATSGAPVHPYAGIVLFLVLPAIFLLGLVMIPAGVWWRRRALRRRGDLPKTYPRVHLGNVVLRRTAAWVGGASLLNVVLLAIASYRGVHYMDSTQFCGLACHSVMAPQYAAFVDSPHARVGCVQCHIGPGASWFVRSKLSGARQLWAVNAGSYSRPIPSPVHELRPARETCEQCHWPRKFHGDKLVVKTKFEPDEANTRSVTVLMLRVGGQSGFRGVGIHGRHLGDHTRIEYLSTPRRDRIARVFLTDDTGRRVEYATEDAGTQDGLERRAMDCMDCHNRPTHAFDLPERAVDRALAEGRISAGLPFVRREAVRLLRAPYPDRETAAAAIVSGLEAFYAQAYPAEHAARGAEVRKAAEAVRDTYLRNVFPSMKVGWGTYPNNIGHEDFPGCFRCHDDQHRSADGRVLAQDCDACHAVLAMEESDPKILADLGLK
jgi:nitrate/TMAO reductase-like tetraheme cytochrome c subunit